MHYKQIPVTINPKRLTDSVQGAAFGHPRSNPAQWIYQWVHGFGLDLYKTLQTYSGRLKAADVARHHLPFIRQWMDAGFRLPSHLELDSDQFGQFLAEVFVVVGHMLEDRDILNHFSWLNILKRFKAGQPDAFAKLLSNLLTILWFAGHLEKNDNLTLSLRDRLAEELKAFPSHLSQLMAQVESENDIAFLTGLFRKTVLPAFSHAQNAMEPRLERARGAVAAFERVAGNGKDSAFGLAVRIGSSRVHDATVKARNRVAQILRALTQRIVPKPPETALVIGANENGVLAARALARTTKVCMAYLSCPQHRFSTAMAVDDQDFEVALTSPLDELPSDSDWRKADMVVICERLSYPQIESLVASAKPDATVIFAIHDPEMIDNFLRIMDFYNTGRNRADMKRFSLALYVEERGGHLGAVKTPLGLLHVHSKRLADPVVMPLWSPWGGTAAIGQVVQYLSVDPIKMVSSAELNIRRWDHLISRVPEWVCLINSMACGPSKMPDRRYLHLVSRKNPDSEKSQKNLSKIRLFIAELHKLAAADLGNGAKRLKSEDDYYRDIVSAIDESAHRPPIVRQWLSREPIQLHLEYLRKIAHNHRIPIPNIGSFILLIRFANELIGQMRSFDSPITTLPHTRF